MLSGRRGAALAAAGLLALTLASAADPATRPAPRRAPAHNLIFMIPDGCGPASMTLARMVGGRPLALDGILKGAAATGSSSSRVTDSAAGATAYASGVKTANAMLGLDARERPVGTLLEAAQALGMATGLVVTSRITHATPAAFASHVHERVQEDSIAVQEMEHRLDVMFGGGRDWFVPKGAKRGRKDGRDLLAEARASGVQVIGTLGELRGPLHTPVLGLFTPDHMSYEIDRDSTREPSLAEMTTRALALLSRRREGFFVMVEGSRIDHAAHEDDPAGHAREVLAYDEAVRVALDFARRDQHTLVLSVADHETGGLTLGRHVGNESPYEFRPESLLAARASAERIADSLRTGGDPAGVIARLAGVHGLTDAELGAIANRPAKEDRLSKIVGEIESARALVGWTTWGHTAVDVGLYASGPGAERFAGTHENTDVCRIAAELAGLDLAAATRRLRSWADAARREAP